MEADCKSFVEELGVAWNSFLVELIDVSCKSFLEEPMVRSNWARREGLRLLLLTWHQTTGLNCYATTVPARRMLSHLLIWPCVGRFKWVSFRQLQGSVSGKYATKGIQGWISLLLIQVHWHHCCYSSFGSNENMLLVYLPNISRTKNLLLALSSLGMWRVHWWRICKTRQSKDCKTKPCKKLDKVNIVKHCRSRQSKHCKTL